VQLPSREQPSFAAHEKNEKKETQTPRRETRSIPEK